MTPEKWFKRKFSGKKHSPLAIAGFVIVGILIAVLFAFLFGIVVMLLWNWLMPLIFGLIKITYWQAVGLVLLARILFGGIGGKGDSDSKKKKSDSDWDCKEDEFESEFEAMAENWAENWDEDMDVRDWKKYKKYWKEEGKASFKEYLEKTKSPSEDE